MVPRHRRTIPMVPPAANPGAGRNRKRPVPFGTACLAHSGRDDSCGLSSPAVLSRELAGPGCWQQGRSEMHRAAFACLLLSIQTGIGSAWAEEARRSSRTFAEPERQVRAEERSRAATSSICHGCGVGIQAREQSQMPREQSQMPRQGNRSVARRSRITTTRTWNPPPGLPLTSTGEVQVRDTNQLIAGEQQRLRFEQQTQFELNQLRHELSRDYLFR